MQWGTSGLFLYARRNLVQIRLVLLDNSAGEANSDPVNDTLLVCPAHQNSPSCSSIATLTLSKKNFSSIAKLTINISY
jgi:hypothetical protein